MMLQHLGEKSAAKRLMKAVERVTADPSLHTPTSAARQLRSKLPKPCARNWRKAND